jgi:nucleoside-diphosphate-sugar epimerase
MLAAVDVRDVAAAHLAAMLTPEAAGQRFCCVSRSFWIVDLARTLNQHFASLGYPVPVNELPDFLIRVVALFDKTVRLIVPDLSKRIDYSSARAASVLGWKPRPIEESIIDMGQSLIDFGFVAKK